MYFFHRTFLIVLIGVGLTFMLAMSYMRQNLEESIVKDLSVKALNEAKIMATLYDSMPETTVNQIIPEHIAGARISLINAEGTLISDSLIAEKDFSPVHNYADRPEVKQAINSGSGVDIRYHDEIRSQSVFAAARLKNNNILRIATPTGKYLPLLQNQTKVFSILIISTGFIAFLVAFFITKPLKRDIKQIINTIEAIAMGKYQLRLSNLLYKEFTPLEAKVNYMATQVEEHIRTTADQKEQLQSILDTMTEGVLVLGPNGSIRRYNRALRAMFPNIEKAHGMQVVEAIPAPSLQKAIENIIEMPAQNGGHSVGPLQFELAHERVFSIQLTRAGTNDVNLGAVAVFHDISGLMRLERVRSDFVANVSHELRTPLTAIQGYAETLTELDNMPENSRRFAEIIRKHGAYLARMVEELLALARLESGDVPMQIVETNPLESINAAIALCRRQFDLHEVEILLHVPENLTIMASIQHLTQIFRNLLENAGRYAPKGGQVHIKALQDPLEKSMTRFAVCDNGPGIPAPDKDRIFERFYRVEKHRSHASTGLGLAICKHTVERLGGRIWVESPTDAFATVFYFTIPTALGDIK